jgi:hypothetical protein
VRLDNIFHSSWLNFKLGRFELDNLLSEKRILTLTGNGGIYQTYHFMPVKATATSSGRWEITSSASSTWDTRRTTGREFPPPWSAPVMET